MRTLCDSNRLQAYLPFADPLVLFRPNVNRWRITDASASGALRICSHRSDRGRRSAHATQRKTGGLESHLSPARSRAGSVIVQGVPESGGLGASGGGLTA